jgi:hypothetical protein
MNERLREPVARVLGLLAQKKYAELARLTNEVRLSAPAIAQAVADYGRTLVEPPDDAFNLLDAVQVRGAQPPRWSITMPVWTKEEGRSDLSVELTVTDCGNGFSIELDDLHVL